MKNIIACGGILSSLFLLAVGCSGIFLNEGATRVRATQPSTGETGFNAIYFEPNDSATEEAKIKKGEYFSLTMLSAFICDFRERRGLDIFLYDKTNQSGDGQDVGCTYGGLYKSSGHKRVTRGEITLIVNSGESSKTKSLTMNPSDVPSNGRVIYYNDDIRESGQLINALNLPIYGPKKYNGKNFLFEMWMLELDGNENDRIKALLDTLADIGGTAYPPSSPILNLLNHLGGAILAGRGDDLEARFQMRFDVAPPTEGQAGTIQYLSKVHRLPLMEGYYAFVREENRDLTPEWSKIGVNKKLGVLCNYDLENQTCINKNDPFNENNTYRDRTWFLVRVARESADAALDIEYGEALSKFLERLDQFEAEDSAEAIAEIDKLEEKIRELVPSPNN